MSPSDFQLKLEPQGLYAQWRVRRGAGLALREDAKTPPERLLQAIWQHQRVQRETLRTLDGETLRVLHPGFASLEGGPDFLGAVLQFGESPPQTGDVEVDLRKSGWHAHGHDRNPAFAKVALHVVWEEAREGHHADPKLRTVVLREQLDAPLAELSLWLDREPVQRWPESLRGKCSAPLRELSGEQMAGLLAEAARVRFSAKAAQLQARARQAGWEQALWEGLFRALGYKHNIWPMQCLAETRHHWARRPASPLVLQSRLLGLSSLLPTDLPRGRPGADDYVRRVWDSWWRERDEFHDFILPRRLWRFHGLRPANHPQRRLALAASWLAGGDLPGKLQRWCARSISSQELERSLLQELQGEQDDFWSWHWTIGSPRLQKPQPLLGRERATDLAINVILPWLWTRAAEGANDSLRREIEGRYFAWPKAQDNSVLRLAGERLLGGSSMRVLRSAAHQQGLLQIVRDFCDHSNAICDQCGFPEFVREWRC